jgi:non-ribosomal peptide synthetase component F
LALAREGRASRSWYCSLLAALLTRLGAGNDIAIGSPMAGAPTAHSTIWSAFVNTLELRTDTSGNRASGSCQPAQDQTVGLQPPGLAVRAARGAQPGCSPSRHPLFQVMLAFQNNAPVSLRSFGLTASRAGCDQEREVRPR